MLTYDDVEKVLPETEGIKGASISFECIVFSSTVKQSKGLFIQAGQDEDLQAAISNGAIAAVWPSQKELPVYTPNHFPVFLAEDGALSAAVRIVEKYKHKMTLEKKSNKTVLILPESEKGRLPLDITEKMELLIHAANESTDWNGVR